MSAIDTLTQALDAATTREHRLLDELNAARVRIRALERGQERDTKLIAEQTELIDKLGRQPARAAA